MLVMMAINALVPAGPAAGFNTWALFIE